MGNIDLIKAIAPDKILASAYGGNTAVLSATNLEEKFKLDIGHAGAYSALSF